MANNPNYIYTPTHVKITIHKPLYGTFCYIRETHVLKALHTGRKLLIKIPQGEFERTPQDWMENSQRIEKVFLRPDEPMVLLGNHVIHSSKPVEEKPKTKQFSLF